MWFEWYGRGKTVACGYAAALLCALAATPAQAAAPLFSAPVPIASSAAGETRAVLGPEGDVTVAWAGKRVGVSWPIGVYAAHRAATGGEFSSPQLIADEYAFDIGFSRNEAGVHAAGWDDTGSPRVAVSGTDGQFAPAEAVPVPPRSPAADESIIESGTRHFTQYGVAVAANGAVLATYVDVDYRAANSRAVTVLRHPDGSWDEPQVMAEQSDKIRCAADGVGGLHVVWQEPPAHEGAPGTISAADAGTDGRFGPGQVVSSASPDRSPTLPWETRWGLSANREGALLAVWWTQPNYEQAEAAVRPAGGEWSAVRTFGSSMWPAGALNEKGDAVVTWTNAGNLFASLRPANGEWGPESKITAPQRATMTVPVTLDSAGHSVMASALEGGGHYVGAWLAHRGSGFGAPVDVSPRGSFVGHPALVGDPAGNGVVTWTQDETVWVSDYTTPPPEVKPPPPPPPGIDFPPVVTSFRVGRRAFSFRVTEPTPVTVTVRGRRGKRARQSHVAKAGSNRVAFSRRVKAMLRRDGNYRATIATREGLSLTRRVTVRRRGAR
jgi:hypothetical protein